ncbi:MAG TPA: hypothetical protein ENK18_19210 [Deltaproteobacteria bacterium]|nr:hypothetical protein [Deltaproteobacteria bacterium]
MPMWIVVSLITAGCAGPAAPPSDKPTGADTQPDTSTPPPPTGDTGELAPPDTGTPPVRVSLAGADVRWLGAGAGDWAGRQIGPAGDVNGDGLGDVLVTAHWSDAAGDDAGATYLLLGPGGPGGSLADAHAILLGEGPHDASGVSATTAGDVDGDGFADLIIGADGHDVPLNNAGTIYLVRGPVAGTIDLADADAKATGEGRGDLAGVSVAGVGDVDGDGLDDVLVGARYNDEAHPDAGAAYLLRGPLAGTSSLADADAKLLGESRGDWAGITVAGVGDVDGDGLADLGIGARYADRGPILDVGASYLVLGPVAGTLDLSAAEAVFVAEGAGDEGGMIAGGGDTNGDGHDDVLIGARLNDREAPDAGIAYLLQGPGYGVVDLALAHATITGEAGGDELGFRLDVIGDVDGDGNGELIIAGWRSDEVAYDAGAVYLFLGPVQGLYRAGDADRIWLGEALGDWAGSSVSGGDIDGDGLAELMIGASFQDGAAEDAGAIYLVYADSLRW